VSLAPEDPVDQPASESQITDRAPLSATGLPSDVQPVGLISNTPSDPPWSGLDVFRILIVVIICIFACGFGMLVLVPGATFKARALRLSGLPELLIVAQMLAYLLILGYMYILVTKERGSPRFWKALHWNWPENVWPFLGVGFAMQVVFVFVERFLPFPRETPFEDLLQRHTVIVMISVFSVTLGPLMEELFFRGFLYPVLARSFGMALGICLSALGFGLMHAAQYGYSWASVLLIFVVGMVLGVVRAKKDSVGAGLLVHVAYNGTITVAMFAATGGFRHLEKLNR